MTTHFILWRFFLWQWCVYWVIPCQINQISESSTPLLFRFCSYSHQIDLHMSWELFLNISGLTQKLF